MIYKAQKLLNMCPEFSCCGRAGRLVVVSDLEIEKRWWWCKFLGEFVWYAGGNKLLKLQKLHCGDKDSIAQLPDFLKARSTALC